MRPEGRARAHIELSFLCELGQYRNLERLVVLTGFVSNRRAMARCRGVMLKARIRAPGIQTVGCLSAASRTCIFPGWVGCNMIDCPGQRCSWIFGEVAGQVSRASAQRHAVQGCNSSDIGGGGGPFGAVSVGGRKCNKEPGGSILWPA